MDRMYITLDTASRKRIKAILDRQFERTGKIISQSEAIRLALRQAADEPLTTNQSATPVTPDRVPA